VPTKGKQGTCAARGKAPPAGCAGPEVFVLVLSPAAF